MSEIIWAALIISIITAACVSAAPGIVWFWLVSFVVYAVSSEPHTTSRTYEQSHQYGSSTRDALQYHPHLQPPVDNVTFFQSCMDLVHTFWGLLVISLVLLVLLRMTYLVLRKRALIRAVAICLPLEMTRCEPLEPRERFEATEAIFRRMGIRGQVAVNVARGNAMNIHMDDARAFIEGAEYVAEHRRAEDRSFVVRRLIVRWLFDSFAALAGDMKSVDVAWSKAVQAMEHWYRESRLHPREQINVSRLPNLAKAMNLPHDLADPQFAEKLNKANSRSFPKGAITFWLAMHLFDYKRYLRYGLVVTGDDGRQRWMEFQGRHAFEVMRMYQAWQAIRLDERMREQR